MRKDSYESILCAVGRVLDHAEARGFAIRETADGLHVESFDAEGTPQYTFQFGVRDLVDLLEWAGVEDETPRLRPTVAADEGTLANFVERHTRELVGTRR
jgi:hypothetical protein